MPCFLACFVTAVVIRASWRWTAFIIHAGLPTRRLVLVCSASVNTRTTLAVRPLNKALRTAHLVVCPAVAGMGLESRFNTGQAELEERERKHFREKDAGNFEGAQPQDHGCCA